VIEAGLALLVAGDYEAIPVNALLRTDLTALKNRAFVLARKLRKDRIEAQVVESDGEIGGGIAGRKLPSYALAISGEASPDEMAARLRTGSPVVLAIVREGRLLVDLRSVLPQQDDALLRALVVAAGKG